jgi:hypothetical protein
VGGDGGPDAEGDREEAEIGEVAFGEDAEPGGGKEGDGEDRAESQVLAEDDAPLVGSAAAGSGEEQGEEDDVVDVGDCEGSGGREDGSDQAGASLDRRRWLLA